MPATAADSTSQPMSRRAMPLRRCAGRTASSTRCACSSWNFMTANPTTRGPSRASSVTASGSRISARTRSGRYVQPRPASMRSRARCASSTASLDCAIASSMPTAAMGMDSLAPARLGDAGGVGARRPSPVELAEDFGALIARSETSRTASPSTSTETPPSSATERGSRSFEFFNRTCAIANGPPRRAAPAPRGPGTCHGGMGHATERDVIAAPLSAAPSQ